MSPLTPTSGRISCLLYRDISLLSNCVEVIIDYIVYEENYADLKFCEYYFKGKVLRLQHGQNCTGETFRDTGMFKVYVVNRSTVN